MEVLSRPKRSWIPNLPLGLRTLSRFLAIARLRMTLRRMATPRRMVLTAIAALLAALWLGQTVAGILFRPAADPQRLAVWIPTGFLAYAIWNLIKTTCRKPIEPFEWTPTERELLIGAPLTRQQLVLYRLRSIISSAAMKAACFSVIMLPDIRCWPLAFVGMLLALTLLDQLRMWVEVVVWGITRRQLNWLRTAVITLSAGAGISALVSASCLPESVHNASWPAPFGFALCMGHELLELRHTLPGKLLMQPFQLLSRIMLADTATSSALAETSTGLIAAGLRALAGFGMIGAAAWALVRTDARFFQLKVNRDKANFDSIQTHECEESAQRDGGLTDRVVPVPNSWGGTNALYWRQLRGMWHYRHSLALSFLLPGVLSLLPLFSEAAPFDRTMQIIGSLVFYSFVLLPSALRFDYRRDIERMAVLKALPISPARATLGQLAGPVVMCTLFQSVVLTIAMIIRPYHPAMLFGAVFLLLPVNALIFGIENLIFLLFPYRHNQEGINVFLRSILTFTAKGLLFVVGLLATLGIALVSASIANHLTLGSHQMRLGTVFSTAMWLALMVAVSFTFFLLASVYRRFDPSQDVPAMS